MSDARLRELVRAAAQGDREAAVALLLARVRGGALGEERLRLAAYLGDEAARSALGAAAPTSPRVLGTYVKGLEAWGKEAWVRAGVALARAALRQRGWQEPLDVEVAVAWRDCPCEDHRRAAAELEAEDRGPEALTGLSRMVVTDGADSLRALSWVLVTCRALLRDGGERAPDDLLRRRVREALVPWALG